MGLDSKFKVNLNREHFPEALEKYTRFPKFTLLFSISYVRINGEALMRLSLLLLSIESKLSMTC